MTSPTHDPAQKTNNPTIKALRTHNSQQDEAIPSEVPGFHTELTLITPGTVRSLQRLIGNQAVQRLLDSSVQQRAASGTIQRQTGLAKGGAQNRFVAKAKALRDEGAMGGLFKPGTVSGLLTYLGVYVNRELERAGTPHVSIDAKGQQGKAFFDFKTWKIELN